MAVFCGSGLALEYPILPTRITEDDIVVCVQGDEPMLVPDMIDAVVAPLKKAPSVPCTMLAMHITEEAICNPDTVKLIHNDAGEVLYTSRAPVPHCEGPFTPALGARRIYGIFAFRWRYLKAFTQHPEIRLGKLEACDRNRILDMSFRQHIAPYPYIESFSVDSSDDIKLFEKHVASDRFWRLYK